jgi:hypothetical protein
MKELNYNSAKNNNTFLSLRWFRILNLIILLIIGIWGLISF